MNKVTKFNIGDDQHFTAKVNNLKEFLEARGLGESDMDAVSKNSFRYTNYGVWVDEDGKKVRVGCIIEGVSAVTETHELKYPFEIDAFWETLQEVAQEAGAIWDDTHGCPSCGEENEDGNIAINSECKSCYGEGIII